MNNYTNVSLIYNDILVIIIIKCCCHAYRRRRQEFHRRREGKKKRLNVEDHIPVYRRLPLDPGDASITSRNVFHSKFNFLGEIITRRFC
jgi:hypothetical protein